MKKNARKLTLSKETLRSLASDQMVGVEGGEPPATGRRDCYSKVFSFCETCGIACTIDCHF